MTIRGAAAAVGGARHARAGRNGQDAAAWSTSGAIVVCDGCGSGASSEVGARLGAQLVIAAITRADGDATTPSFWTTVRAEVVASLDALVRAMPGEREQIVHDYFLFTVIAAVAAGDEVAVWAIGDGAYAIDGCVRELGPFEGNQPPYIGYDLVDNPQVAHMEVARAESVIVATDGVAECGLERFARGAVRFVNHPDALRRELAMMARAEERLDWDARRVLRAPALLQDDGAVAMLVRGGAS